MRWESVILLALPLCACVADQKKQLTTCELEATQLYPSQIDRVLGRQGSQVHKCMASKGYELTAAHRDCVPSPFLYSQVRCYQPMGRVERVLQEIEDRLFSN